MTNDEIMKLTTEQLRFEIAKIRGYFQNGTTYEKTQTFPDQMYRIPNWTTSIADAWKLVEEIAALAKDGWEIQTEYSTMDGLDTLQWRFWFSRFTDNEDDYRSFAGEADTAPLAICRAWLLWKTGVSK